MFCGKCGRRVSEEEGFCSNCGAALQAGGVGDSAPCPKCGCTVAAGLGFTWWGGFLGPKLFNHAKCCACGTTYNAVTGRSNRRAIVLYQGVTLIITLAIITLVLLKLRI